MFSNNWYQSQKVYLAGKLAGNKGSWFEWEQWKKKECLGSINLMVKTAVMEYANGGLFVPGGSVPAIGRKSKKVIGYEG